MPELETSAVSALLLRGYKVPRLRPRLRGLAGRLEGGQFRSATLRAMLRDFHGVDIGAYSYGGCFTPGAFPGGAWVGRYVSMAENVVRRLNHPLDRLVLHPYFYNENLGFVAARTIAHQPITIGHDAWIGQSVIFTEGCTRVGIGAVIGAGSIVTRDVGDFDIVAGTPARRLRRRFSDDLCAQLIASRWWERPVEDLAAHMAGLMLPVHALPSSHPLLQAAD